MREEEGRIKNEKRTTKKKKKRKTRRNDVSQKNGTRKEEAHYRIYFVSERWFAAYPGAQKNRASSSSTIKSDGVKEGGGVNYGNHEFSVTGGDFKKLFSTRPRNCTRPVHVETSRDPRDGGRRRRVVLPEESRFPDEINTRKRFLRVPFCLFAWLIDSMNLITDSTKMCVFFRVDRDSGFE